MTVDEFDGRVDRLGGFDWERRACSRPTTRSSDPVTSWVRRPSRRLRRSRTARSRWTSRRSGRSGARSRDETRSRLGRDGDDRRRFQPGRPHVEYLDRWEELEATLGRSMTLNQAIAAEVETITAPLAEVVEWVLTNHRVRPGFAELAARRRPTIVSAGFREMIEPVLAREGIGDLPALRQRAGSTTRRVRAVFRDEIACDVCLQPCKRWTVAGEPYAYVGDGWLGDGCVALAADRVFARDGLARRLAQEGVPFEPFDDLHDVANALA